MNCFVTGRGGGRGGRREGRGPSKMNVFAITWIRLIWFGLNLAWTYYLTLGTSLRKNFSFFSKSKMAAAGQKFARRYTFVGATNWRVNYILVKNGEGDFLTSTLGGVIFFRHLNCDYSLSEVGPWGKNSLWIFVPKWRGSSIQLPANFGPKSG